MSTFFNLPAVGEEVHLLTHLVVREDAHVLYGFATEEERRLFRNLLKVSGVGPEDRPGAALGHQCRGVRALRAERGCGRAHALPGIGRKTAERLIIEMRDRLEATGAERGERRWRPRAESRRPRPSVRWWHCGYKPAEATRLLKARRSGYTFHRGTDPPRPAGRAP